MPKSRINCTPFVLCILDGWGDRAETSDNAIAGADAPTWRLLGETASLGLLDASETFVGLPSGQMGNSEVGHMNLGAGRVVMQDLPRIDDAISSGAFATNRALQDFIHAMRESGGTAHILGMISPGGVHSHQDHVAALAETLNAGDVPVAIHGFLDGRDVPPRSAGPFIQMLEQRLAALPNARIASVSGRYYAMDRDSRWDRVGAAWRSMVLAEGTPASSATEALDQSYGNDIGDEFVLPRPIGDYAGMSEGDGIVMANFRADRAREILESLITPDFGGFDVSARPRFAAALGMVAYSETLSAHHGIMFPPELLTNTLGEVLSANGLRQLRIAETEKYAHVTFFLNGGAETELPGETRILIPSPDVPTYDLKPEMSAEAVTDKLIEALEQNLFDVAIVNYANTDMVGHTGDYSAAVKAVEAVDRCLGRLVQAVDARGGAMLITADHGNADIMRDATTGSPHTAHTLSRVPVRLVGVANAPRQLPVGRLCDVAPTILDAIGIARPAEMTGRSLLEKPVDAAAE